MSNSDSHLPTVVGVLKAIVISGLKLCALVLAFVLNLLAIIFGKLAELLQKASGYGQAH